MMKKSNLFKMIHGITNKTSALIRSLAFIIVFIISLVLGSMLLMMLPKTIPSLYYGIFGTMGALLTAVLFVRIEKQTLRSIGLHWELRTPLRFMTGIAIGIGLFAFVIAFICLFGGVSLQRSMDIIYPQLLISLLPVFPLALMEEIGFRTYPLVKLEKVWGIWPAQIVIAFAFAIYHILNGWGIGVSFMGPFIWAFVFGLAAIRTRGIAMPTGIHFSLNIMQHIMGAKNNGNPSLFTIVYPHDVNGYAGIFAHLFILLGACVATRWYASLAKARPRL